MPYSKYDKIIYHIDVNSAFLSWEATYRVNILKDEIDLRNIPSAVGGDKETRHGIILAKSSPAKKYNITTGEPVVNALKKCPDLVLVPPNFPVYVQFSNNFIALLKEYAPVVEQYSIDEAFCDMTGTTKLYGSPIEFAHTLKDKIKNTLGFTVNIGISTNKLLAKMASDFEKPDKVHTLFPDEIKEKLWPLPVSDLLFVGKSCTNRLNTLGIKTISELANTDPELLKYHLKKHGEVIWNYANGVDDSDLIKHAPANKGYGNSITIAYDVTDRNIAKRILLSLCETVAARIRADKVYISVVSVSILDNDFNNKSHQMSLPSTTDVTEKIYEAACKLFDSLWDGLPIRQLGVQTSKASSNEYNQLNLFDLDKFEKFSKLNNAIDSIRNKYGEDSIKRACFIDSNEKHMSGGLNKAKRENTTKKP